MPIQPIHLDKPLQFDAIYSILVKNLGKMDDIEHLAAHICDEKQQQEFQTIIHRLLERKIHIHQLLTTFSACEKDRLQYAFVSTESLPDHAQLSSARKIIEHFNRLQDLLLASAENYFQDHQQRRTHQVDGIQEDTGNRSNHIVQAQDATYHHILERSLHTWKKDNSIMVHNYYRGLSIRARVGFLEGSQKHIRLQLNEELARVFAAHPTQNTAFVICPDEDMQLRLNIEKAEQGEVLLHIDEAFPVFSESRKHLNVQIDELVPIFIQVHKKRRIQAQLHDLSIGGLGMIIQGINKSPCQISDQVQLSLLLDQKEVQLEGTVRWTGISDDEARIGIELNERFGAKQAIQKEISRIQRQIIVTINHLAIPDNLAAAIR